MSYSGKLTNSVSATESDIFSRQTLDNMRNGVQHTIPVQASFNVFNYINITPSFNYNERWYFKKVDRQWNPTTNMAEELDPRIRILPPVRLHHGPFVLDDALRHVAGEGEIQEFQAAGHTPHLLTVDQFSYAPDFSNQKYGYFKTVQSDSTGRTIPSTRPSPTTPTAHRHRAEAWP